MVRRNAEGSSPPPFFLEIEVGTPQEKVACRLSAACASVVRELLEVLGVAMAVVGGAEPEDGLALH